MGQGIIIWDREESCFLSCIKFNNVCQLVLVFPQMGFQLLGQFFAVGLELLDITQL